MEGIGLAVGLGAVIGDLRDDLQGYQAIITQLLADRDRLTRELAAARQRIMGLELEVDDLLR